MKTKNIFSTALTTIGFALSLFVFAVFADEVSGPGISLRSTQSSVQTSQVVKITASFTEAVARFTRDQVAVDGGNVESVRKLGPTSYLIFVRAGEGTRYVNIQVEAGVVQNLKKVYNDYASNELVVRVVAPAAAPSATDTTNSNAISNLLQQITNNTTPAANTVSSQPATTYVNCNGTAIPSTQTCATNPNSNPNVYNPYAQQTGGYYDAYGNYIPAQTNPYASPYSNPYSTSYSQTPVYDPYTGTYYYPANTPVISPTVSPYSTVNPYSSPYSSPYANTYVAPTNYNTAPGVYSPYTSGYDNTYSAPGTYGYAQPMTTRQPSLLEVFLGW